MVCKICGGKTSYDMKKSRDVHEAFVVEAMDRLKNASCEDLIKHMQNTIISFEYFAAKRILIERGHGC